MKVGLIARAEDRGLGVMTHAFWRHMHPAKTLVVTLGDLARGFPAHVERYTDMNTATTTWDGDRFPDEQFVREWLADLDVLYTAETFYDWRIVNWCKAAGVATVLHSMPEFYPNHRPEAEDVTRVWLPTTWRQETIPRPVEIIPVPTEPGIGPDLDVRRPHWVHVAGHRAMLDRNGTGTFLAALPRLDHECDVTLFCQDQRAPSPMGPKRHVKLTRRLGGVKESTEMYLAGNALVMPRKYGGLCLPVQEAAAQGMALLLPAVPPNDMWPSATYPAAPGTTITTSGGDVDVWKINPIAVAETMNSVAADPSWLERLRCQSYEWAVAHSWDNLRHDYDLALREAVGSL